MMRFMSDAASQEVIRTGRMFAAAGIREPDEAEAVAMSWQRIRTA
jgi:hypothetical protein